MPKKNMTRSYPIHLPFVLIMFASLSSVLPGVAGPGDAWTNSIGMEFVLIPEGSFVMGYDRRTDCPEDNPWTNPNERYYCEAFHPEGDPIDVNARPAHRVTIERPFLLGKYEVTQEQWYKVMGTDMPTGSAKSRARTKGVSAWVTEDLVKEDPGRYPIDSVTRKYALEFIKRLNEMEGTTSYRLPSEAEWEYAARAGESDAFYLNDLDSYAWYNDNSFHEKARRRTPHKVGLKKPNPWGLYDIFGNVTELCADSFVKRAGYEGAPTDGSPITGRGHTSVRGGSYWQKKQDLRAGNRGHMDRVSTPWAEAMPPGGGYLPISVFGFRVAKTIE